jgi:FAD/FMN-containing dehydrogenase
MTEAQHGDALRTMEQLLGDRVKRGLVVGDEPSTEGTLASVLPMDAEEVRLLAEVAGRYSVPLVALGGKTAADAAAEKDSILVRFDLMRRTRLTEAEEHGPRRNPGYRGSSWTTSCASWVGASPSTQRAPPGLPSAAGWPWTA